MRTGQFFRVAIYFHVRHPCTSRVIVNKTGSLFNGIDANMFRPFNATLKRDDISLKLRYESKLSFVIPAVRKQVAEVVPALEPAAGS